MSFSKARDHRAPRDFRDYGEREPFFFARHVPIRAAVGLCSDVRFNEGAITRNEPNTVGHRTLAVFASFLHRDSDFWRMNRREIRPKRGGGAGTFLIFDVPDRFPFEFFIKLRSQFWFETFLVLELVLLDSSA